MRHKPKSVKRKRDQRTQIRISKETYNDFKIFVREAGFTSVGEYIQSHIDEVLDHQQTAIVDQNKILKNRLREIGKKNENLEKVNRRAVLYMEKQKLTSPFNKWCKLQEKYENKNDYS